MYEGDPQALRLVFEREGDEVRLVEAIPVDMIVPPSDDLEVDDTKQAGFAVRVYEKDGTLVYRRGLADPLAREAEIYTDNPDQPFVRLPISVDFVQFEIVVPNTRADVEIELVASPPRTEHEHAPGRPLMRTPLPAHGLGRTIQASGLKEQGGNKGRNQNDR